MPETIDTLEISGYTGSTNIVTLTIDTAFILSNWGYDFLNIKLYDADDTLIQTETESEVVIDSDAIYSDGGVYKIHFEIYCDVGGEEQIIYISSEGDLNSVFSYVVTISEPVVVIPLQNGGKVSVPIIVPGVGDYSVSIPLKNGSAVATKLFTLAVGDPVVVVQLQNGGKVAVPLLTYLNYGEILIDLGVVPAGQYQTLSMEMHAVTSSGNNTFENGASVTYSYILDGVSQDLNFEPNSPVSWGLLILSSPAFGSFAESHNVSVKINVVLPAGEWFRIDYIYFRNFGFNAGQMYPDGSFESGAFGDGTTQWKKTANSKVRIIDTDAYSGSYCCEFYG